MPYASNQLYDGGRGYSYGDAPSSGTTVGGGALSGAGTGASVGLAAGGGYGALIGALIGAAAGAGSGYAQYQGMKKSYHRRKNVIDSGRNQLNAVYNREIGQQFGAGGEHQNSLRAFLDKMISPEAAGQAEANAASRQTAITAATAPLSAEGAATVDGQALRPEQVAGYQSAHRSAAAANQVDMARALIDEMQRGNAQRQQGLSIGDSITSQRRTEEQLTNQLEIERIQRWLEESLGTDSNAARNLQLLSSLLGTGSSMAMQYAGSQGGRGPSQSAGGGWNNYGGSASAVRPSGSGNALT